MKSVIIAALFAGVECRHHHHRDIGLVQSRVTGIDKKTMHPDQHWRLKWPQGIDDSTDDDKVVNWPKEKDPAKDPIKYHDKMRQWQPGTWPIHHTWNDDWSHASYHNEVDDGTDDNEVVDLMHHSQLY